MNPPWNGVSRQYHTARIGWTQRSASGKSIFHKASHVKRDSLLKKCNAKLIISYNRWKCIKKQIIQKKKEENGFLHIIPFTILDYVYFSYAQNHSWFFLMCSSHPTGHIIQSNDKKELRLCLWNMVIQSTLYKRSYFKVTIKRNKKQTKFGKCKNTLRQETDKKNILNKILSTMPKLHTNYYFWKPKTWKWTIMQEEVSGSSTAPNTTRRTSCKPWNSPAYYLKFSL